MAGGFEQAAVHFLHAHGYAALFVLLALETAMILHFVPSEVIVPAAAAMLAANRAQLFLVIAVSTLGATAGSLMLYAFARYGGRRFLDRHPRLFGLNAQRRASLDSWFRRPAGENLVFFFRLLPFLRAAVSIPAGLAAMDARKFTIYSAAGSALFNTALAYPTYAARANPDFLPAMHRAIAYSAGRWPFFLAMAVIAIASLLLYRRRHVHRSAPHPAVAAALKTSVFPTLRAGWTSPLRLLYWIYEVRLSRQVRRKPMPGHVGIIVDGNRRHGRKQGLSDPREIYQRGAQKLDEILEWCAQLRIPAVTLWVFSTENLKRSAGEVSGILAAIETKIASLGGDALTHRRGIRVRAIGRLETLPPTLLAAIRAAESATCSNEAMTLNIAVGYGGREEIADAVRAMLSARQAQGQSLPQIIEEVTPEAIAHHLYTSGLPDPDLVIRTSGELRLSGFLLWQSAHAEFYFTDVLWPALRRIDFLRAIRSYQDRDRRFGR